MLTNHRTVRQFCGPFLDINSSEVGLVISSTIVLAFSFQWSIRQSAEVENQMTSVERVIEYTKIESEAALESSPGNPSLFKRPNEV